MVCGCCSFLQGGIVWFHLVFVGGFWVQDQHIISLRMVTFDRRWSWTWTFFSQNLTWTMSTFRKLRGIKLWFRKTMDMLNQPTFTKPEALPDWSYSSFRPTSRLWIHPETEYQEGQNTLEIPRSSSFLGCFLDVFFWMLFWLLRSPLARKIYSSLLSDPVWADFWPMVAPRIPELYQVWMNGIGNWDNGKNIWKNIWIICIYSKCIQLYR